VLKNATFVASVGRFSQPPDFSTGGCLFDDTLRTGRFAAATPTSASRRGAYEFQPADAADAITAVRSTSMSSGSTGWWRPCRWARSRLGVFGNGDFGTVKGVELLFERDITRGWGVRATYALMGATATATNAFRSAAHPHRTLGIRFPRARGVPLDYDRRHAITVVDRAVSREGARASRDFPVRRLEAAAILATTAGCVTRPTHG